MQLEPQPLKGFLLRLIHLHNLEHMKGAFLSMEARGGGGGGGGGHHATTYRSEWK